MFKEWWEDFRGSDWYWAVRQDDGEAYAKIGWQIAVETIEDLLMDKCAEGSHQDCDCIYCVLAEEIANKIRSM